MQSLLYVHKESTKGQGPKIVANYEGRIIIFFFYSRCPEIPPSILKGPSHFKAGYFSVPHSLNSPLEEAVL